MNRTRELDILLNSARATPEGVALRSGERSHTYSDLRAAAALVASLLRRNGAEPGDVIALLMENSPEFVAGYFGIRWLGGVAMPLNPKEPTERLRYCLAHASSTLVLLRSEADANRVRRDDPQTACLSLEGILDGQGNSNDLPPPRDENEDAVALIMFTTGTTGAPKGVLLRDSNVMAAMRGIQAFMRVPAQPIEVLPMPLYHSFGLARMRGVLALGGTLVLERGLMFPAAILDSVERYRATGIGSVPAGWDLLLGRGSESLRQAFRSVRYVEIGSAPMPIDRKRELMALLPHASICMHYGLTEASRSAFMEFHADADDLTTIGKPLPGVEVTIRDDAGAELPDGLEGEICVKGPTVFAGYLGDEAATAAAFFGPWLRTGDVGRRKPSGRLYLTGRVKELINLGGSKISPLEIEQVLDSCPGVRESAVIGVTGSGTAGEVIHAFVVPSAELLAADVVREFAASRLDPQRRPAKIHLVDALPKSGSGKLLRRELRSKLSEPAE